MYLFYIFACLPVIIGLFLWIFNKQIVWKEWLIGSAAAFLVAVFFHVIATVGMTSDTETWSGIVTHIEHHPRWVEEYEEMHTEQVPSGTDSNGNTTYTTRVYWTTEHDTHPEHWRAYRDFGKDTDWQHINLGMFNSMKKNFGDKIVTAGKQAFDHGGEFDGGDNNIYAVYNGTGYVYPVTKTKRFENRIKAAPSVFSFIEVPTNVVTYPYPQNGDWMHSDRLLGTATRDFSLLEADRMNSRLGPLKKVNVIIIGFGDQDSMIAEYQEAAWVGGKKNDLVLCYGNGWSRVFGWSESELAKENLQSLLLKNEKNDALLKPIEKEILANYTIKDWDKFDYITIEPRTSHYVWFLIVMIITQGALYAVFHFNSFEKGAQNFYRAPRYRRFYRR